MLDGDCLCSSRGPGCRGRCDDEGLSSCCFHNGWEKRGSIGGSLSALGVMVEVLCRMAVPTDTVR